MPTTQTAINVDVVVRFAESKMFSQKSLKQTEKQSLKRELNGSSFVVLRFRSIGGKNEDLSFLEQLYVKETLSCFSMAEKPFF